MASLGIIIVLNGAPRSGKSSIAEVIQERFDGPWMNLGVDVYSRQITPSRYRPGIGLRPGGERPDLEELVPKFFAALYDSIAVHSRLGLNVVVDIAHHDAYSQPLGILTEMAVRVAALPAWLVGVRCPIEEIMRRRAIGQAGREGDYVRVEADDPVPDAVLRWQREVHVPGIYDLEVDTSVDSPTGCVDRIEAVLHDGSGPTAFTQLGRHRRS